MKYNSAVLSILGFAFGVLSIGTSMGCGNKTVANSKAEIKTRENISCRPMQKVGVDSFGSASYHYEVILDPELGYRVTNIRKHSLQCPSFLLNSEGDLQIVSALDQIFSGKCQVRPEMIHKEPTGLKVYSFFEDQNGEETRFEGFVEPSLNDAFQLLKKRVYDHIKMKPDNQWGPC